MFSVPGLLGIPGFGAVADRAFVVREVAPAGITGTIGATDGRAAAHAAGHGTAAPHIASKPPRMFSRAFCRAGNIGENCSAHGWASPTSGAFGRRFGDRPRSNRVHGINRVGESSHRTIHEWDVGCRFKHGGRVLPKHVDQDPWQWRSPCTLFVRRAQCACSRHARSPTDC